VRRTGDAAPSPRPVRYALLATLFAVVGIGLVTSLYARGVLPIAGPFALLFLLPILLPLQRRMLRRRQDRHRFREQPDALGPASDPRRRPPLPRPQALRGLTLTTDGTLQRLGQRLEDERALPHEARSTTADDAGLDGVISLVARARASYAAGHHEVADDLLAQAAYVTVDSWSHASPVAEEVLTVRRALARASKRS
jgi:hypothetical protein